MPARFEPTDDATWLIEESGYVAAREHEVESIMALANGYLGVRSSLAEGSLPSDPATYLANVFVDSSTGPVLARTPHWLPLLATIDGQPFTLAGSRRHLHRRLLDMRYKMFWRDWLHVDGQGRATHIAGFRFASAADPHMLGQTVFFTPRNYKGELVLEAGIGGAPGFSTVFWKHTAGEVSAATATADLGRGRQVIAAGRSALFLPDGRIVEPEVEATSRAVYERWMTVVEPGQHYRLDRVLFHYATPDSDNPVQTARAVAVAWRPQAFETAVARHQARSLEEWAVCDLILEGDDDDQRALRFAAYHMNGCVQAGAKQAAVGPRGLTGGGYGGHVFWDTEVYVFPFLLYTQPAKARAVLGYRYATLPGAREEAAKIGCAGANFAWESADTGRENTPEWILTPDGHQARVYCGEEELHVTADIAYAVWQYWEATQDLRYLAEEGAEILMESARFWATRGRMEDDGQFHLRKVMGPDEYHPTVDDNAYTNGMARHNCIVAARAYDTLARLAPDQLSRLRTKIGLAEDEPARWCDIAERFAKGRQNERGVIEQFAGFWDLADAPPPAQEEAILMQTEAFRGHQILKQADLLMLFTLHPAWFSREVQRANFDYYEPRTWHGSSLSPGIHALVAARLGDTAMAHRYFKQTAAIDLAMEGNASVGVHLAALGSLWMAAVYGFAGVQFDGDCVSVRPHLPPAWDRLAFRLQYRGRTLAFDIGERGAQVEVERGAPLEILAERVPRPAAGAGAPYAETDRGA